MTEDQLEQEAPGWLADVGYARHLRGALPHSTFVAWSLNHRREGCRCKLDEGR